MMCIFYLLTVQTQMISDHNTRYL